jgi:cytochrome c oxidase cbb3-type subunit III
MTQRVGARSRIAAAAAIAMIALAAGCTHAPGSARMGSARIEDVQRPDQITDFKTLFSQNCAGCHGANGRNGAAFDLSNPVYQAWVRDAALQRIISMGEPPTQMPAFAQSAGGMLTDAQVDALVKGMRTGWPAEAAINGLPPADQSGHGDAEQGQKTYQIACARCHSQPSQQITDPTYLALINNRTLRTIIVAGRPDLGHPDWRGDIPGRSLSDQEVSDIIAYLNTFQSETPGQPYSHPESQGTQARKPQSQGTEQ